ncbi:MAG: SAM-dependent methyltransferase [Alphaproteobacteria bacterium]|nr:SAM-dependent methyltransferase [Alphaproteobacteria bacterium]
MTAQPLKPLTTKLGELLIARIAAAGPITVADYMQTCAYHPEHGYYSGSDRPAAGPFGRTGDFVTSPEISHMFGELIGLWCADHWQSSGLEPPIRLIELGPGRGTAMADAVRSIVQVPLATAPEIHLPEIHLVETSPRLRQVQARTLAGSNPVWHDRLEDVPPGPAIIVANEFFDALPVRQLQRCGPDTGRGEGWRERLIGLEDGALAFQLGPVLDRRDGPSLLQAPAFARFADGEVVEIAETARAMIKTAAARLAEHGGAMLIIDYGYGRAPGSRCVGSTLQAVAEHRYADPLDRPGEADLTVHVDFSQLAHGLGDLPSLRIWGPVTQGIFLTRLGIDARATALSADASPAERADIAAAAARLTAEDREDKMGRLFKVMCLTTSRSLPAGFESGEREHGRGFS